MFLATRKPSLYPLGANFNLILDEFFENSFKEVVLNKYPATDIYTEDGVTYIEVAVTGFSKEDIEISLESGLLTISGKLNKKPQSEKERKYHTRNIAKRSFKRQFNVIDEIEDVQATVKDGILYLKLIEKEKESTLKRIPIE